MPQGATLSRDGALLIVVESGVNPPGLGFYSTNDLHLIRRVPLAGAFGRPVWTPRGILVAGANADAIFSVNAANGRVQKIALPRNTYPISVAVSNGLVAVATDHDDSLRIAPLGELRRAHAIRVGKQLGNVAFSTDGGRLFVTVRSGRYVAAVNVRTRYVRRIRTDLHPSDVLVVGKKLYVAAADADTVCDYDVATGKRLARVFVGTMPHSIGSSPNALSAQGDKVYVSLGAANDVVVLQRGRAIARLPAGWYPTAALALHDRLFVIDGKGEGMKANPGFNVFGRSNYDYIGAIQFGSIRELSLSNAPQQNPQGALGAGASPQSVVHSGGPIRHVFFILKENRTYDQILGDVAGGNGEPKLAYFGARYTPNQHAIVQRFGLFDDFYSSGEVSDSGHNLADGAFANDYVERMWPPIYGGRNDDDQTNTGIGAGVAARGYIWDAARRAGVSFRDYGEMVSFPAVGSNATSTPPSLRGRYDPHYIGWNLEYSDLDRYKEWKREFDRFVGSGAVPQLEWMWLPNDHTQGPRAGKLTPGAYIAQNDYAVGLIVEAISHSNIWNSSAIFIVEDDAQDGADHVSAQRTTFYLASPYAAGGVVHRHYATIGILRTIELLLGMQPLSNYDATAAPLYAAFTSTPNTAPFDAVPPQVDLTTRNSKVAYGADPTAKLDFSRPDAVAIR